MEEFKYAATYCNTTGVLISPQADQEKSKLQRQKILIFIYPIYNHNWRNISTIYVQKIRLTSTGVFSPSNKVHREVGRAKDFSVPRYNSTIIGYKPSYIHNAGNCLFINKYNVVHEHNIFVKFEISILNNIMHADVCYPFMELETERG